jgi:hypothetical protein
MEYILTNALLVLIEYPDTTLLSVNRLFSDKAYRTQVVNYCKDPAVKAFWTEEFANYTDRFAAEALPAIQNKIGQFTGNPLIRNIIGQPHSSFDIRKIMDEKKILIMNLSKGLVGETNANLLGSMLTTRIYLAAMSRADLPVEQMRSMPNFYFYVDEFQSFANATFANILSEARKYHLNLIIAHQYIEQMEEDVRNAVFGNVGSTIAFRVGPFDAEVLETVFSPRFLATDLVNLGFAQIYLTLMIDGIGSQPFSAVTLPPVERPHMSCKDMVVAASRKNYARPREDVEKIVVDLHTPVKIEPAAPKKTPSQYVEERKAKQPEATRPPVPATAPAQNNRPPSHREDTPRPKQQSSHPQQQQSQQQPSKSRGEDRGPRDRDRERDAKGRDGKSAQPARSMADLRAILARLSDEEQDKKSTNTVSSETTSAARPLPKESIATSAPASPAVTPLRSALAEALSKVEQKPALETVTISKQSVDTHTESVSVFVPKMVAAKPPAQESTPAERAELERMAAEAEAAFSHLESKPLVDVPVYDDPLNAKKIEKLFKASGNERTPFAS